MEERRGDARQRTRQAMMAFPLAALIGFAASATIGALRAHEVARPAVVPSRPAGAETPAPARAEPSPRPDRDRAKTA